MNMNMNMNAKRVVFVLAVATFSAALMIHFSPARTAIAAAPQNNQDPGGCSSLPGFSALKSAIVSATAAETSGLNNQMWATLVNRDGAVCAVAFSGVNRGAQWPGSRVISAQKANTANAFSLDSSSSSNGSGHPAGLALSTANLYSAVQPGGNLYGLQHSNPVDTGVAYGAAANYGTASDPMMSTEDFCGGTMTEGSYLFYRHGGAAAAAGDPRVTTGAAVMPYNA